VTSRSCVKPAATPANVRPKNNLRRLILRKKTLKRYTPADMHPHMGLVRVPVVQLFTGQTEEKSHGDTASN
jgi:hypothetical protein